MKNSPRIGQVIATGADDGKILLTLLSKAQVIETLTEEHSATIPIHSVSFSSNSLYIGSGAADGTVKIWNLKTRALQVKSQSHSELVYSVAWNSNDSILASGSMNGMIALHTTEKQLPIGTLTSVPHVKSFWGCVFRTTSKKRTKIGCPATAIFTIQTRNLRCQLR